MPDSTKPTLSLVSPVKPSNNLGGQANPVPSNAVTDTEAEDLTYLENEDFLNMGVFELLGIDTELSQEEQLAQLNQMQGIIIADFLEYDIPNLVTAQAAQALAEEMDMQFASGSTPAAVEEFMIEELEKLGVDPQEALAIRSVIFKHALIMEHVETIRAAANILQAQGKQVDELNSKLVSINTLVEQNNWKEFPLQLKQVDEIVRKLVSVVE